MGRMLLRFSFSNFRSFRDEQEFSLIASQLKGRSSAIFVPGLKEGILPVAAVYGANASGKTNLLIVCEGGVTEPRYFTDLRISERALLDLDIVTAGVPKSVVERAVELRRDGQNDARRSKDRFLRYDEVWCVFDVDEHPRVAEAKQQAGDNGLEVAISNPCFELWALLHFQDRAANINRHRVQHLCRNHMPGYEKELNYAQLETRYEDTARRAWRLDHIHELDGRPGSNPSTGVHRLVAVIKQRGQGHLQTRNL